MQTKTNIFTLGDEKKHSVVYICDGDPAALARSIYVNKTVLGAKPYPQKLKITMESAP